MSYSKINTRQAIDIYNGDMSIRMGESIIGFDMELSGIYELESYDIHNFMMFYNDNRVIGVGFGSKLGKEPFLKYTGSLLVRSCQAITDAMNKVPLIPIYRNDRFDLVDNNFDSENTNIEDLNKNHIYGEIPNKIKTTFLNKNIYNKDGKKVDVNSIFGKTPDSRRLKTISRAMQTGGGY